MAQGSNTTLHFFGNGVGESIVVESPAGWGVVDCFRYEGRVPSLEFLKSRGVSELKFLAITHPHEDHFDGVDELIHHYLSTGRILEFWRFPGLDAKHLFPLLKSRALALPQPFLTAKMQSLSSLQKAYEYLGKAIKARQTELKVPQIGHRLLHDSGSDFYIEAVSPPGTMIMEAENALADFESATASAQAPKRWDANKISVALKIFHQGNEALLAADTPDVAWKDCFSSSNWSDSKAHVLKCSHHGSSKDNTAAILDRLCSNPKLAVVTRYSKSRLPRTKTLQSLESQFDRVVVLGSPLKIHASSKPIRRSSKFSLERLSVELSQSDFRSVSSSVC